MGGREPNYLPTGIFPDVKNDRIPMHWAGNELVWLPATNPPNGAGQFMVKDKSDGDKLKPIGPDFPEPGAAGPFNHATATRAGLLVRKRRR
jgi:hypothetical protein